MISFLHMIISIFIEKKLIYMVDFLNLPNNFYVNSPSDFNTNWVLDRSGRFILEVSFFDVSLYEYLADNGRNEIQLAKWENRMNTCMDEHEGVCKWRLKSFKVVDDKGQKRTCLSFCQR